jgi:hypothetical protein
MTLAVTTPLKRTNPMTKTAMFSETCVGQPLSGDDHA